MLHNAQGQPVSVPQIVAYLDGEAATPERLKDLALHLQTGGTLPAPAPPELNISAASREPNAETARSQTASHTTLPQPAATVPEELRPLVQQQLDAAGTQRLFWHGEVWPGQTMQWQVEWNGERNQDTNQSEPEPWLTTLRLTTPRLGEVEASLRLGAGGVHIALNTPYDASAAGLRSGAPDLEQALAAAGVPLLGLTIKHTQEE